MIQVLPVTSLAPFSTTGEYATQSNTLLLKMASAEDSNLFVDYLEHHFSESGASGMPRFSFHASINKNELRIASIERWTRPLDEPNWGRTWLLWNPLDSLVIGHLELRGGKNHQALHRADLSMGLRQAFTANGLGTFLLNQMFDWSLRETSLQWIDLGVFSVNEPARKLYKRMGFEEVGYRNDAFRLDDDTSIDEVLMSRRVRGAPR